MKTLIEFKMAGFHLAFPFYWFRKNINLIGLRKSLIEFTHNLIECNKKLLKILQLTPKLAIHRNNLSNVVLKFFNGFYTILRKSQYLRK